MKYIKLQEEKCELMKDTADMIANDLAHAADKGKMRIWKKQGHLGDYRILQLVISCRRGFDLRHTV